MKDNSLEITKYIQIAKKNHKEGKIYQANEIYKNLINQKIYSHDLLISYGIFCKEINNIKIYSNCKKESQRRENISSKRNL